MPSVLAARTNKPRRLQGTAQIALVDEAVAGLKAGLLSVALGAISGRVVGKLLAALRTIGIDPDQTALAIIVIAPVPELAIEAGVKAVLGVVGEAEREWVGSVLSLDLDRGRPTGPASRVAFG